MDEAAVAAPHPCAPGRGPGRGPAHLDPDVTIASRHHVQERQPRNIVFAFVRVAILLGLGRGHLAYRTDSIRWPVISYFLLDFAGLGGRVYLS